MGMEDRRIGGQREESKTALPSFLCLREKESSVGGSSATDGYSVWVALMEEAQLLRLGRGCWFKGRAFFSIFLDHHEGVKLEQAS